MDIHSAFRRGAEELVRDSFAYGEIHRAHGIMQTDWDLLTQNEHWTVEQTRRVRGVLAACIEVCMTIAGMPAVPLPGQYAAAVIAIVVAPANRMLACMRVPETFDAVAASGLQGTFEIRPMRPEQIMSLVMAYSGGIGAEPPMQRLPKAVVEVMKKEQSK